MTRQVQKESTWQTFVSLQIFATSLLLLIIAASNMIECDRQVGGRRLAASNNGSGGSGSGGVQYNGFKSNCGSGAKVAKMVGKCAEPIFELVEGKFDEPKVDEDFIINCNRFNVTDKCIRQVAKDCLFGLQKTSVSSVASATRRLRASECKNAEVRARYKEPLKCAIKTGREMEGVYKNHTAIAQAIRDLPGLKPEEKIMKVCCLLNSFDRALEDSYNRVCPDHTGTMMKILHTLTDDARNTLCRGAKCENALNKVTPSQLKEKQNFIEPIMEILFMINDGDGDQ